MAKHNDIGLLGEQYARIFLEAEGYEILFQNKRFGRIEIDLIARKNDTVHFVEVKTRSGISFGFPEEAVTPRREEAMRRAANLFLEAENLSLPVQFDIIAILLQGDVIKELLFLKDCFY